MSTPATPPPAPPARGRGGLLRRLWRRVENVVFGVVLLLIVLYFILQMPMVQNWLIGKITGYLSKELETTVQVRHVDIEFFDNLALEGFFVADQQGDTLLYAQKLAAGLNSNIFALFGNKLEFNEITLQGARFNIRREAGQADNNLQFILDYFGGNKKKPKPEPKPFRLRVQNLRLSDIEFSQRDAVSGRRLFLRLHQGAVRINRLDLGPNQAADIRSAQFDGLTFSLQEYAAQPLRKLDKTTEPADTGKRRPSKPFLFNIQEFSLNDGRFFYDKFRSSPGVSTEADVIDYNHLAVTGIELQADSVRSTGNLAFAGILRHLAARERSGFQLEHAEAASVLVNDTITALYGMTLRTPATELGDTLALHYNGFRDYLDFVDRVRLDLRFREGAHLLLGDIRHFSPAIARNSFFNNNRAVVADLSGTVYGAVNDLRGRELNLRVGQNARARLDFRADNLARGADQLILDFKFDELKTDISTIRQLIPGFNAPRYFDKLGQIGFEGSYSIIFGFNHIAKGSVLTSIGSGDLDMELDLTEGRDRASYSGMLNMRNFDLGAWTGNKDLGRTSFRFNIAEGSRGLTLPNLDATIDGRVDSLNFRDYNYRNVNMHGRFKSYVFDGAVDMNDPNIIFDFNGNINLKDSIPVFAFRADLNRLDLGALNMVEEDWILSGKIDNITLRASSWNDVTGVALLRNFKILQDKQFNHRLDSLRFSSGLQAGGRRYFSVKSDLLTLDLEGRYDLKTAVPNLLGLFGRHFPEFAQRLKIKQDSTVFSDQYTLNLHLRNSRSFTQLFDAQLDTLENIRATARVDAATGFTELLIDVPWLHYGNAVLYNTGFYWRSLESRGDYQLFIPNSRFGKRFLAPLQLQGALNKDVLSFDLRSKDTASIVSSITLGGEVTLADSLWQIRFNASELALFQQRWYMDEDNFIRFGKGYFDARNFDLMNGNQRIVIDPYNENKGLIFYLTNFDLDLLNPLLQNDRARFRGKIYDFDIRVNDLFALEGIESYINTDTFFVNEKPYGVITGNVEMARIGAPLWARLFVNDLEQQRSHLRLLGAYAFGGEESMTFPELGELRPGELQARVDADDFPLEVLETFVPGISRTSGLFDASVTLGGAPSQLDPQGKVMITRGQVQIDYLKSMFHIKNQPVKLSNRQIWADGDTIYDATEQSMAFVQGGLWHNHFKDWRIDCTIKTQGDNFMVLNTRKEDNSLFYGQALGRFTADFSGTFARTNIRIDAVTGRNTRLYVPLTSESETAEINFITFQKKLDTLAENNTKSFRVEDIKGLNFEMNVTVTDVAEIQLIFDEKAGDIITGRGSGDLKLVINREGEFNMYGTYRITRGEYLFTLLNLVNKPFTVLEGGTVEWSGDPYTAQINLYATYEKNTSIYNFLRDEIEVLKNTQPDLFREAQKSTRVVVTMHLSGELFKPHIDFDLNFPNLISQVKTLADNKLRLLRQDQNEINRQVFGLIVVGSFLPPNAGFSADYVTSGINTVTQFLSSQLSNYLTGLANEWFGGTVSSIDFDIAYNEYRNDVLAGGGQPGISPVGRELQVRLTGGFVNDRITIQVGSQFGVGNRPGTAVQDGLIGEDVVVEIQLTENRNWRVKVYQRLEPDITAGARRQRYGFGINFRKEYDTFDGLVKDLTSLFREKG